MDRAVLLAIRHQGIFAILGVLMVLSGLHLESTYISNIGPSCLCLESLPCDTGGNGFPATGQKHSRDEVEESHSYQITDEHNQIMDHGGSTLERPGADLQRRGPLETFEGQVLFHIEPVSNPDRDQPGRRKMGLFR
jgi:hypothetical protein